MKGTEDQKRILKAIAKEKRDIQKIEQALAKRAERLAQMTPAEATELEEYIMAESVKAYNFLNL